VRLGPGDITGFQSGLVTGVSTPVHDRPAVVVTPFTFAARASAPPVQLSDTGETDLERIVEAANVAATRLALPEPRSPWPAPLPDTVTLDELAAFETPDLCDGDLWSAPLGLLDDPSTQTQRTYSWRAADGNLLVYGVAGSGTSTALVSLALSLGRRYSPEQLHLYALDFGTQALAPLAALPHMGSVLQPAERERHERLVRMLRDEVTRRQHLFRAAEVSRVRDYVDAHPLPAVVLLVDNWSAFTAAFDDVPGMAVRDDLTRVIADGAGLGVYVVATADRPMAIPAAVSTLVPEKLALRLSDRHDFGYFGISAKDVPQLPTGRALHAGSRLEVQLAIPGAPVAELVAALVDRWGAAPSRALPTPVGVLPEEVALDEVAAGAVLDGDDWWLPVGVGADSLTAVGLRLSEGEHVLYAGASRSGRSTLLVTTLTVVARHRPDIATTVVALRRSPLRDLCDVHTLVTSHDGLAAALDELCAAYGPRLLVIDDADTVDDPEGRLAALARERQPGLRIVAAGRADTLRTTYGHWTAELRRSRQGVVLKPRTDADGELWSTPLPRYGPSRFSPGRGYLVADGEVELVQVAQP
jgi:S-DNA-T family DNA segregation ATPase FtsK/SpoIIIE